MYNLSSLCMFLKTIYVNGQQHKRELMDELTKQNVLLEEYAI